MPYISRLKKLGTLPAPELQTTLTVYLITLEDSQKTNLVYTADDPIPVDVSPPAHLRFECPDGHTKGGDVLIWAERIGKRACHVRVCWVFDGTAWIKPNSDSEIMMDHPVHSQYQLVILSGPFVKWELKPGSSREPSLTVPDPPPVRSGARGSQNTILTTPATKGAPGATELSDSKKPDLKWLRSRTTKTSVGPSVQHRPTSSRSQAPERFVAGNHDSNVSEIISNTTPSSSSQAKRDHVETTQKETRADKDVDIVHRATIHVKRHRPASPHLSPSKRHKMSVNVEEPRSQSGCLDEFLRTIDTTLLGLGSSAPATIPISQCSQEIVTPVKSRTEELGVANRQITVLEKNLSATKADLEVQRAAAIQASKDALDKAHASHSDQLARLREELATQTLRATNSEASLYTAQEALVQQRSCAQETEARQQRALDLADEKLQSKEEMMTKLVDEVNAVKQRVAEIQDALSESGVTLEKEKDKLKGVEAEKDSLLQRAQDDQRRIALNASATIDQLRRDNSTHREELTNERQSKAALEEQLRCGEDHLAQERAEKLALETRLDSQKADFQEFLKVTDNGRRKIEQLFLMQEASLHVALKAKTHAFESMQTECIKWKNIHASDHEQLSKELSTCRNALQTSLEAALREQGKAEEELGELRRKETDTAQGREAAQAECTTLKATLSKERDRFQQELTASRSLMEVELTKAREQLEENIKERERLRGECVALETELRKQTGLVEAAQAECLRLKADSSSERERHAMELSDTRRCFEEQLVGFREQREAIGEKRKKVEKEFQAFRANFEAKEKRTIESLKTVQADNFKLNASLQTERERFSGELSSVTVQLLSLQKSLATVQGERTKLSELLTKELSTFEVKSQSMAQRLEEAQAEHSKTLAKLAELRHQAEDILVRHTNLEHDTKVFQLQSASKEEERKSLEAEHAKLLEAERLKCESAEKLLDEVRRECREPFVIPALLDLFVGAHREAAKQPEGRKGKAL